MLFWEHIWAIAVIDVAICLAHINSIMPTSLLKSWAFLSGPFFRSFVRKTFPTHNMYCSHSLSLSLTRNTCDIHKESERPTEMNWHFTSYAGLTLFLCTIFYFPWWDFTWSLNIDKLPVEIMRIFSIFLCFVFILLCSASSSLYSLDLHQSQLMCQRRNNFTADFLI